MCELCRAFGLPESYGTRPGRRPSEDELVAEAEQYLPHSSLADRLMELFRTRYSRGPFHIVSFPDAFLPDGRERSGSMNGTPLGLGTIEHELPPFPPESEADIFGRMMARHFDAPVVLTDGYDSTSLYERMMSEHMSRRTGKEPLLFILGDGETEPEDKVLRQGIRDGTIRLISVDVQPPFTC